MNIELTILHFRECARQVLAEHIEHLKEYNKDYLLHNRLTRLRFFNKHLKALKVELVEKMDTLLAEYSSIEGYEEFAKKLHSTSIEYIDEYLSVGFGSPEGRES